MINLLRLWLPLITLLLGGCTSTYQLPKESLTVTAPGLSQQEFLSAFSAWQLTGKMSFKGHPEDFSGTLIWQQQHNKLDIRLNTYLGISVFSIKSLSSNKVVLEADGKSFTSNNPEQLLTDMAGISLPLNNFKFWVKGQVDEESVISLEKDEQGLLKQVTFLDSNGQYWTLDYQRWQTWGHWQLPQRLTLKGKGVTVKILIKEWLELTR